MVSESEMFEKSFDHFWFFIFLVTLATVPVSFSIYYHFLCKMFTNFSPRRHVNDFKGTYFVEKINIYQIKNIFVSTSKDPRIEEFISSAAHFRWCVYFTYLHASSCTRSYWMTPSQIFNAWPARWMHFHGQNPNSFKVLKINLERLTSEDYQIIFNSNLHF